MVDTKEALDDLEAMLKEFRKDPYGKFNDARVVWLVTTWVKFAVASKGSGMYTPLKVQFLKRGNPGKPSKTNSNLTWRVEVYADLVELKNAMSENKDNPNPHKFDAAEDSMVAFVEDYRNQYKRDSKEDKTFDNQLRTAFLKLEKELAAGQ